MMAVVVQSKIVNLRIVSMVVIVKVGAVLLRIVIVKPVNVLVVWTSGRLFAESQNCYLMHLKQLIKREISLGDGSYNIFFEKH